MKKVLSLALALVMMMAIAIPAFAADAPTDLTEKPGQSGTVIVKTDDDLGADGKDPEKYLVTIPADTVIPWGQAETDVSYSVEAHLKANRYLKVDVAGTGAMTTADGAYSLAYTLEGVTAYEATYPVVFGSLEEPGVAQELKVLVGELDWNLAVVGEYSDTLTYTASIIG